MNPRKVAVLYDGRGYGGAETHLELLLRYLDRTRFEPHVLIPGRLWEQTAPELKSGLRNSGTPVHVTPEPRRRGGFRAFLSHVALLRALHCDVAYVATSTAIGLRRDLLALRLAGLPVVRLLHMPPSSMKTFHNGSWSPLAVRLLDRLVNMNLTVSSADREELIHEFGIPGQKVEVCRHGLELDKFLARQSPAEARRALGLAEVPTVGLVGRFVPEKGHRYFVEAAPAILDRYGPVQFVMVGQGETEERVKASIAEKGLAPRFVLPGFQRDVRPWIEALDIVVMPSLFESAGLVLLECLAMGRPAVASDLASIREYVGTDTCSLVPVGDSTAIAGAVVELLHDLALRRDRAERGTRHVREHFDIRRHVAQIMDTLERVAPRRHQPTYGPPARGRRGRQPSSTRTQPTLYEP